MYCPELLDDGVMTGNAVVIKAQMSDIVSPVSNEKSKFFALVQHECQLISVKSLNQAHS